MSEAQSEVKIADVLKNGQVVLEKVLSKELTLTKAEMIALINFESAVKWIIEAEEKAEAKRAEAA